MTAPLLAVDAPSILFRSFFALPESITDGDGRPVNALLGTANQILFVVEAYRPRAVVLCFGPDAAPYRVEAYPAYHADRPPVPDALVAQFADAAAFFGAFGWTIAHDDTVEADDLLGSYARIEAEAGGEALVMTGDRDLYQCVGERVKVLYVKTGAKAGPELVDADEVRRRYGVDPAQVPDFIALRGDPSDGLPGAKGIGEKRAADLLRRHGSLEGAIAGAVRESSVGVRTALLGQADELRTFLDIATLRQGDAERPPDPPTDWAGAAAAARERGLNPLAERLEQANT